MINCVCDQRKGMNKITTGSQEHLMVSEMKYCFNAVGKFINTN